MLSEGPIVPRLASAVAAAKHSVMYYPYSFRLTSILVTGIAGGVAHLHTQRSWLHRNLQDGAPDFVDTQE